MNKYIELENGTGGQFRMTISFLIHAKLKDNFPSERNLGAIIYDLIPKWLTHAKTPRNNNT
jgi:predicted Rdx family selenoprotein